MTRKSIQSTTDTAPYCGPFEYRYGGKELLTSEGLNLYRFGARMYDPALLRFITPDPLRHETPRLSSYLYCAANPVMYVDPSGLYGKRIINTKDKAVTIRALYFVVVGTHYYWKEGVLQEIPGYNDQAIKEMRNFSEMLNGLGLTVQEGTYQGYDIIFDLTFEKTDGRGTAALELEKAKADRGINANVIYRDKEYYDEFGEDLFATKYEDGKLKTVGGVTAGKYQIVMNVRFDFVMYLLHEIFHTLGLEDIKDADNGKGIMAYPPQNPNDEDMIELMNNTILEEEIQ